jgi:DNA-binding Lrp family transcriptional regulator
MDEIDSQVVMLLQGSFAVIEQPYREAAAQLGLTEDDLITRLKRLQDKGIVSRFGPLYQLERLGGAYSLAAMQVPDADYERIVELVNDFPEVTQNFRREHAFNMWFVVFATNAAEVKRVLFSIERDSTYLVFEFPKLRDCFVDFDAPALRSSLPGPTGLDEIDRAIFLATQAGLPFVSHPWHEVARQVGATPAQVMERVERMLEQGVIRRVGLLCSDDLTWNRSNGMSVWDVDDYKVDALSRQLVQSGLVRQCYLRPRQLPEWPYNLVAMVYGEDRNEVENKLRRIAMILGSAVKAHEVLYSRRMLRKNGLSLARKHGSDVHPEPTAGRENRSE